MSKGRQMSPGEELRAARLRDLHQTLRSDPIQSRYKHLYHAAIRSDDSQLQAIIDGNVSPEMRIPEVITQSLANSFFWKLKVEPTFAELLSVSNELSHETIDDNALKNELTHTAWNAAGWYGNSRLAGFDIKHYDEFAFDIMVNQRQWSGRVVTCDEWSDNDPLFMRLEELGNLIGGELLAIKRFPYQKGERSFGYLPGERFVTDKHVRVPITDERLRRRLDAFYKEAAVQRRSRMKPVHYALAEQQSRLSIDGDRARKILQQFPKSNRFGVQGILIEDIENHNFHTNVGRYGRMSNNITAMKREVRSTLHVEGEPLWSVDISCCQPTLITKLMRDQLGETKREGREEREERRVCNYDSSLETPDHYDSSRWIVTNEDFELYQSLVQTGELYDFLENALLTRGISISREKLKKRFLTDILAKKGQYSSSVEKLFRELFPTVYCFIQATNRRGKKHANLIRQLQREESSLVIETVAADLVTRFPGVFFLTLHDAIYSTAKYLAEVELAFKRAFELAGFPMHFKTSDPNPQ